MKELGPSAKPSTIDELRYCVAAAEATAETAKQESDAAKKKRKEAKEVARRAKKRLRRALDDLAEAQWALAAAEGKAARQRRPPVSQQIRLLPLPTARPIKFPHA